MKRNLLAEMKRFGLTHADISSQIGITERALQKKIAGESDFYFREVESIRDRFFPQFKLEYLMHDDPSTPS